MSAIALLIIGAASYWIASLLIRDDDEPIDDLYTDDGNPVGMKPVDSDLNIVALRKGGECYVFLYDEAHKTDALRTLGRFATNPDLSFSWLDAAVLSQRIHEMKQEAA